MYTLGSYKESDRMSDLICNNYTMLLVISRFGIALGFGDKTVAEVCRDNGVDAKTFLTIVNFVINVNGDHQKIELSGLSIHSLVLYLKDSHSYFLDFKLPSIRQKLSEAVGSDDVAVVILRYYDEYVGEVRKHMKYEEDTVFPYVEELLADGSKVSSRYNIEIFCKKHDKVEAKLSELKNIIIKYYPAKSTNALNSVLFDIFSCEEDLTSHIEIEDNVFIPAIRHLESQKRG